MNIATQDLIQKEKKQQDENKEEALKQKIPVHNYLIDFSPLILKQKLQHYQKYLKNTDDKLELVQIEETYYDGFNKLDMAEMVEKINEHYGDEIAS